MTVTSLDAAADRDRDESRSVLGDMVLESVKFACSALTGTLGGGEKDDPELAASLIAARSYAELRAMVLLLADCADTAKVLRACGINPGLAAGNAKRMAEARHRAAEYAWLRDGGVISADAAARVGVNTAPGVSEYESAYRADKRQREGQETSAA